MKLVEKGTTKAKSQRTDKNSPTWTAELKKSLATARRADGDVNKPTTNRQIVCVSVCVCGERLEQQKRIEELPSRRQLNLNLLFLLTTRTICSQLPPNYA